MDDDHQKGHYDSKPYYVIDKDTGKIIPVYLPADAVIASVQPGYKAGNPLIDKVNDELKKKDMIQKMKYLYKIISHEKE